MNRFLLLSLLAIALAACQTPETEPAAPTATPVTTVSDPAANRAAIEANAAAYQAALQAGDPAAISALYADDAVIHPSNEPAVRGREGLDAYFVRTDSEPEDITITTEDVVISESGEIAYEVGSMTGPGWTGKYLTVHRRTPDGWRIVADSWSEDAPPTPAN